MYKRQVWKPAASSWARAIALSSASLPLPNIVSAQGKVNEYAPKEKQSMQAYTYGDNISKQHEDRVVRVLGQLMHEVRILVLGRGLTYVHFELALKEFEGDYLSSGEGDVGRGHILLE